MQEPEFAGVRSCAFACTQCAHWLFVPVSCVYATRHMGHTCLYVRFPVASRAMFPRALKVPWVFFSPCDSSLNVYLGLWDITLILVLGHKSC